MSEVSNSAVASSEAKASKKASKAKAAKPKVNGDLKSGSTRLRLFKALGKFASGLSATAIKEKTGMLPGSGHLAVLLGEEQEAGRIKGKVEEPQEGEGRAVTVYSLTAQGKKDLAKGEIDRRGNGEGRCGVSWTKARRKASA